MHPTSHNASRWARLLLCLSIASGCGSIVPLSVSREQIAYSNSVKSYRADGGAVISNQRYSTDLSAVKTICVAPPPQAGPNLSLAVKHKGKVNVLDYVEIENDNSVEMARTIAKLYEQNERTLFLQFSLYRLCEAYMNGMLDEQTYAEVLEGRVLEAAEQLQARKAVAIKAAALLAAEDPGRGKQLKDNLDRAEEALRTKEAAATSKKSTAKNARVDSEPRRDEPTGGDVASAQKIVAEEKAKLEAFTSLVTRLKAEVAAAELGVKAVDDSYQCIGSARSGHVVG